MLLVGFCAVSRGLTTHLNLQKHHLTDVEIFRLVWKLAAYFRFSWRLATSTASGLVFYKNLICRQKQNWKSMQASHQTVLLICSQGSYINCEKNYAGSLICILGSHTETLHLKTEGFCGCALRLGQKAKLMQWKMQNGKDLSQYPNHTKNSFWWEVLFGWPLRSWKTKLSCGLLKIM